MYQINGLTKGHCDANDNHADTDVLLVDDLVTKTSLKLCQKCLMQQIKLRSKGRKIEPAPALNGWDKAETSVQ